MNKIYALIFLCLFVGKITCHAQGGVWTWMKGDSTIFSGVQFGNYGIQGVSSPTNEPPGRYHPNYWTDQQGNFWISNGQIFNVGPLNDLWKYSISTNEWTWMNGAQIITNTAGVLGTQGIPSVNNYPPSGGLSGFGWCDFNNNLWFFHSYGDMWKYSIATNEWTWMKGTGVTLQPAVYGVMGVPNISNTPGHHGESKCAWTDASDNLWIYLDGNMWKYDISTNMWTWMKGPGAAMPVANYGTMGVASATNQPGISQSWDFWKDKNGKFIIGYSSSNSSSMWLYDPLTNMWTWISGLQSITSGTGATFISQCTASTNRKPGKRIESRGANYNDPTLCNEYLWFCAGQSFGSFNDLWAYKPSQNTWTWVSGDSVTGNLGNYGTKGVPSPNNMLPCRFGHAMWVDSLQQVWIFGGVVRGLVSRGNDLWRFTPEPSCLGIVIDTFILVPPADSVICKSESTSMNVDTSYTIGVNPALYFSANADTSILTFNPPVTTTYTVTASKLVNNCLLSKNISFTIYVNDYPMPPIADTVICAGGEYVVSLDTSYHFTFSPNALQYLVGNDAAIFKPNLTTTYTIEATKNGCKVLDTTNFTVTVLPIPIAEFTLNPTVTEINNASFTLTNESTYATKYQWFIKNQLIDTSKNLSYVAQDTGLICFQLIATNTLGCVDSITHCGTVLPDYIVFIPNAFSPNGDGVNDVFKIVGKNINLKVFIIYDRWGNEVFYTDDIQKGWNGMYKGESSDMDVYLYYVEYTNLFGKQFIRKGDVSLIR